MTLTCHPEAKPKDLTNEREILRFAQNDSLAVTLGTFFSMEVIADWNVKIYGRRGELNTCRD